MKRPRHLLPLFLLGFLLVGLPQCSVSQEAGTTSRIAEQDDDVLLLVDEDSESDDNANNDFEVIEENVSVEDYLATLSTKELQKICWDRGFDVEDDSSSSQPELTHDDYVEAARRCLTLEEEMNAILNEHPELAAEIEKEIQRLQEHKERLEEERAAMLREKELLEAQLKQAGVDLENFKAQAKGSIVRKDPADMNFPELLVESLRQLVDRVRQDFVFVGNVTKPVWQTAAKGLQISWQHSKPVVMQAWRYTKPVVLQAYTEIRKRIQQVLPSKNSAQEIEAA